MSRQQTQRGGPADERAVTPVIGIVLIVAIVVILSALVAAFALNFGNENEDPAPNLGTDVTWDRSTDGDGQSLTVDVISADKVDVSRIDLTVSGAEIVKQPSGNRLDAEYTGGALSSVGSTLKAGSKFTLDKTHFKAVGPGNTIVSDDYLDLEDANVRIRWQEGNSADKSVIIFRWQPENS